MREWVDWAAENRIGFLQLLPFNENGSAECPYSAISSIALDPIYLSFGGGEIPFLTRAERDAARSSLGERLTAHLVDYPAVRSAKNYLLKISFARFRADPDPLLEREFQAPPRGGKRERDGNRKSVGEHVVFLWIGGCCVRQIQAGNPPFFMQNTQETETRTNKAPSVTFPFTCKAGRSDHVSWTCP